MEPRELLSSLCWFLFNASLLSLSIIEIVNLRENYLAHPTVTSLASSTYPVQEVPFPGISICNLNKISKKRVQNLALEIANITNDSYKIVLKKLKYLGQLYDFDLNYLSLSKLLQFQKTLEELNMDVGDIIKKLATPCDELLKECFWGNIQVNCSSIFLMRLSDEGYCCIFNYVKNLPDLGNNTIQSEPIRAAAGVENGLFVSVYTHIEDYFYSTLSSAGIIVQVFVPTDYPDKATGSVREILATSNTENFIEVIPTTYKSVEDVTLYPIEKRECYFPTERSTVLGSIYSQSDCYVDCKFSSMLALCQCIPFFIPVRGNYSVCNLADVPCLNSNKVKWTTYYPGEGYETYLAKETHNALRCKEACYASCEQTLYDVTVNSFPIFNKSEREKNMTRLSIYYLKRFSKLFRQDVVYTWFEILSNFGGIIGIFLGWSFIFILHCSIENTQKLIVKLFR